MSVLIRGMEMPDACPSCPFVMAYYCLLIRISDDNEVTNYINKRHPDCPLTELPPHGRLIDADEMIRIWDGATFKGSIRPLIDARPTVIEAEGSEE